MIKSDSPLTKDSSVTIRTVCPSDAQALLELYAPYVEQTAITFEYKVPTREEFENRIRTTLKKYPYLAAEKDGVLLGYAYASSFKGRPAYDWSVETSIYVRKDQRGQGIGRLLYENLEKILKKQGILNVNACIAYLEEEDEYLTQDSVRFHESMNYKSVGQFHQCGFKFGRWYDMIWMEKHLGCHEKNPRPVTWFTEMDSKV